MKTIISLIAAALISAATSAQSDIGAILKNYLLVKDALVQSDNVQAAKQAAALAKDLEQAGELKGKEIMLKTAQKISKTPDIEKQRLIFAELSPALWAAVKDEKSVDQNVYYQYCPMKKSYWLSADSAIRNPYYGNKMLTCGRLSWR